VPNAIDASVRTIRHLLAVEQERLLEALRDGTIDPEACHVPANDIASRIVRLERGDYDDAADLLVGTTTSRPIQLVIAWPSRHPTGLTPRPMFPPWRRHKSSQPRLGLTACIP
jgi:hypothetical protein